MEYCPLISIIIPLFNAERFVAACLDSCLNQTFTDWEVLIVNDGSRDGSAEMVARYVNQDSRFKYFEQKNQGAVVARQVGIAHSRGQWITFLDADDILTSTALQILYEAVCRDKSEISVGAFVICNEAGNILRTKFSAKADGNTSKDFAYSLLTEKISFTLCGKLFKRDLFEKVVARPELKIGEDAFVTLQLFNEVSEVSVVPAVVYRYVQHGSSTTHRPSREAVDSILQFIAYTLDYYKKQEYFNDPAFTAGLNYFVIKEYFSYLRMGGSYAPSEVREILVNKCLWDTEACRMTPFWRLMMLRAYQSGKFSGRLYRFVFVKLRSFIR